MKKIALRLGVVLTALSVLSACGTLSEPQTDEARVYDRATKKWNAMISGKWQEAYAFATPAYRQAVSLEAFIGSHSGPVARKGFAVRSVECAVDVCDVVVRVAFVPMVAVGRNLELETDYKERWVKVDGDWYVYIRI